MSDITTAFKQTHRSNIELLLQQKKSKLENTVRREPDQVGEMRSFDRIGSVSGAEVDERHGDTNYTKVPHDRRWLSMTPWDLATLIDRPDKVRTLEDPANAYAAAHAAAVGRWKDEVIIRAATGTAMTGKKGDTPVAFDTANQRIAVDYVESGSATDSGLTIGKLRKAKEILDEAENDEGEERFCVVTAKQITDLLQTTEVTSADYNGVKALVHGEVDTFMGFMFKRVSGKLLTKTSSTVRGVLTYVKSGILLAIAEELVSDVVRLPTKRYSTQVYTALDLGGVRMEEAKVVQILSKE